MGNVKRRHIAWLVAGGLLLLSVLAFSLWRMERARHRREAKALLQQAASEDQGSERRIQLLIDALQHRPHDEQIQELLVEQLWWIGQLEPTRAAERAEEAAEVTHGIGNLWAAAAYHWASASETDKAMRAARQAVDMDHLSSEGSAGVGRAFFVGGDYDQAMQHLLQAGYPGPVIGDETASLLLRAALETDRLSEVATHLAKVRSEHGHVVGDALVQALVGTGDYERAKRLAMQLMTSDSEKLGGGSAAAYFAALATTDTEFADRVRKYTGFFPEALRRGEILHAAHECLHGNPETAIASVQRAVFLSQKRRKKQASFMSEPAVIPTADQSWKLLVEVARNGGNGGCPALLGIAQAMLGERAAARQAFQKALEGGLGVEVAHEYLRTGSLAGWASELEQTEQR